MKTTVTDTNTWTQIVFELEQNGPSERELREAVEAFAEVVSIEPYSSRPGLHGVTIIDGYRIVCVTQADDAQIQAGIDRVTRLSWD